MQGAIFQKLRTAVSSYRLDPYRQTGDSDFDVVANYVWNVTLSESLYPVLQALEIALRNSIHAAAIGRYHTEFWFDLPNCLAPSEQADLALAKAELGKKHKPLEANRIVAELTFGFWTSLLNSRYEQKLWPRMLLPAFPCMPRTIRTRHTLSRRLNEVRHLRNRVFHHERISHLPNLDQQHAAIVEAVGWISKECQQCLLAIDRFSQVYKQGMGRIREELGQIFYPDCYVI